MEPNQTKSASSRQLRAGVILLALFGLALSAATAPRLAEAMQVLEQPDSQRSPAATLAVVENPEITVRILENLLRSILYSPDLQPITNGAQKRGLDLGISRGFSGSQAGKHLMGLSAASFANGPGRR